MEIINPKSNLDSIKEIVPEYYSKIRIVRWLFFKRLKTAQNYVKKIDSKILLDVGCGDGSFIGFLKNLRLKEIWAIDSNPLISELSKKYPHCHFEIQNLLQTKFINEKFDTIVCLDVLEHIPEIKQAITEVKRILKKSGYLIVSGPTETFLYKALRFLIKGTVSEKSGPGAGTHWHNIYQINRLIIKCGFKKIASQSIPFSPFDLFHLNLYQNETFNYHPGF